MKKIFLTFIVMATYFVTNFTKESLDLKVNVTAKTIKPAHPKAIVTKYSIEKNNKQSKHTKKARYSELSHKLIKSMSEEELREFVNVCVSLEYFDEALKALEQLIAITKNMIIAKEARIEIADIYFEKGQWSIAAEKYNEFIKLYPADRHLDYAQYKAIISAYYCLPTYDRDQKMTQEVIAIAEDLLKKDHPFKNDIIQIQRFCYRKLYEHNTDIFNHYMKKGSYSAAEQRLSHIKKTFTSNIVDNLDFLTLELDYKLASAQHDTTRKAEIEQKLAFYPNAQKIKMASAQPVKSYVDFF